MSKFFKILKHWKRVVKLIDLVKSAYEDKKVTGAEAEAVLGETIDVLVDMGIIEKE